MEGGDGVHPFVRQFCGTCERLVVLASEVGARWCAVSGGDFLRQPAKAESAAHHEPCDPA